MMTEDDATERWCPFVRYSMEGRAWKRAINRWFGKSNMTLNPIPARCIASQCMAWRWAGDGGWRVDGTVHALPQDDGAEQVGYCGLAGKPEA